MQERSVHRGSNPSRGATSYSHSLPRPVLPMSLMRAWGTSVYAVVAWHRNHSFLSRLTLAHSIEQITRLRVGGTVHDPISSGPVITPCVHHGTVRRHSFSMPSAQISSK